MRISSFFKSVRNSFLHFLYFSRSFIFVFVIIIGVISLVKHFVFATTPNPGHPWTEVGDGTFIVTGPTVARTYTFPDVDTTILTSNSAVTVPQGGTGLTSIAQGDLLYGSAANTLSALAKDTNATRYLSNTGTTNNPAWAQIDLTNGVTGILAGTNGGTGNGYTAFTGPTTSTKTFTLPDASATILTDNTIVTSAQGGTGFSWPLSTYSMTYYYNLNNLRVFPNVLTTKEGQFLLSGASTVSSQSSPSYPATAGTAGKIIRSDGTDLLATTATYPDTASTSGNILTSDGTNFVSSVFPGNNSFVNVGLYAANITAVTALTSGLTYFEYVGVAPKAYTSCDITVRVTTGAATITWAEVAVFSGAPSLNANQSLTPLGYTSVSGTFNSTGVKKTTVSLTGAVAGTNLWVAFGSQATTRFQIRGMLADNIQSGVFQTASVRPSLASSPQATTLAGATVVPGKVSMVCS